MPMLTTGAGKYPPIGGGGAFPTGIGLVARWRADVGVSTSGGNVTSVTDQSGNGYTITPVGTVALNATGSINGQPAFIFNTANGLSSGGLNVNFGAAGSTLSIFVVGATSSVGSKAAISFIGTAGGSDFSAADAGMLDYVIAGNTLRTTQNFGAYSNFTIADNTQYRMGTIFNGASSNMYLNNVAGTGTTLAASFSATTLVAIGNRISSGSVATTDGWDGPISEIVICNQALNSTQRNDLDAYFTAQWGT